MRPLRRKKQIEVTDDLRTEQERLLDACSEIDILSDQGSVDTFAKRKRFFRDCGCDGPPGGRCIECGAVVCAKCLSHCSNCGKPLCRAHSSFVLSTSQGQARFCHSCYNEIVRNQRVVNCIRFVLSPFIDFGGNREG